MEIEQSLPPNYARICSAFPAVAHERDAIFAYGTTIYNPGGRELPSYKIAHEEVHGAQQLEVGVEWWWERYLEDKDFRLQEEIPAHQADYKAFCKMYKDRNQRNDYLNHLAILLASDLYGNLISQIDAKHRIGHGV